MRFSDEHFAELRRREYDICTAVIAHARETFPSYAAVSDAEIRDSFHQNVELSISTIRESRVPDKEVLRRFAHISRRRLEVGLLVDDLIRAFRSSIGVIADQLAEIAREHNLPAHLGVHAYRLIWQVSDEYTAMLVGEYRRHQLQLDSRDHQIKAGLIESLRTGDLDETSAAVAESRYRLLPSGEYLAFCARPVSDDLDALDALVRIEAKLAVRGGVAVVLGDRIIGVSSRRLEMTGPMSVAYGPARPLPRLSESFEAAQAILAASPGWIAGDHGLKETMWRAGVPTRSVVTDHIATRVMDPLKASGADIDLLLDSVETFLTCNRSFPATGEILHCHPNTVRYRIGRFEELTGLAVDSSEGIAALLWFFEVRSRGRSRQPPSPT